MMYSNVNWISIVVAAIINMAVGFVWYSPMLFGKQWMKYVGMSEKDVQAAKKGMSSAYGIMAVGALIMAFVLSKFVSMAGTMTATSGAMIGFWAWLGFVATSVVGGVLFEKKPWGWYYITAGFSLVVLVINGALLAVWR